MFEISCQQIYIAATLGKYILFLNSHIIFLESLVFSIEVGRDEGEGGFDHDDCLFYFIRVGGPEQMVATDVLEGLSELGSGLGEGDGLRLILLEHPLDGELNFGPDVDPGVVVGHKLLVAVDDLGHVVLFALVSHLGEVPVPHFLKIKDLVGVLILMVHE